MCKFQLLRADKTKEKTSFHSKTRSQFGNSKNKGILNEDFVCSLSLLIEFAFCLQHNTIKIESIRKLSNSKTMSGMWLDIM